MVYPEGIEYDKPDGSKGISRRASYYNEDIKLKTYNVNVTPMVGSLASVKLSKELIKSFGDQIDVILLNKAKVQVSCKSAKIANDLIKKTLTFKNMNFYIPQQKVEVKGRIYLPKDVTEKDAFEGMTVKNRINSSAPLPKIVEVYRVPYFDKDSSGSVTKTDSDFMLISFCGSHIPTHVLFENALLIPVQAYFEPVLQCKCCWFYGHSKRACRGKERCVACGLTHTEEACNAPILCVNCKGPHRSNDRSCPEFLKRKEVAKAKALKTVPTLEVEPIPAPAPFNMFGNIGFPGLPSVKYSKPVVVPETEKIGYKRPRRENNANNNEMNNVEKSSKVILSDIKNKIVKDLSLEKTFFNSIVEEVKTLDLNGEQLVLLIGNKIKEMLSPILIEPLIVPMDESNVTNDGSSCS